MPATRCAARSRRSFLSSSAGDRERRSHAPSSRRRRQGRSAGLLDQAPHQRAVALEASSGCRSPRTRPACPRRCRGRRRGPRAGAGGQLAHAARGAQDRDRTQQTPHVERLGVGAAFSSIGRCYCAAEDGRRRSVVVLLPLLLLLFTFCRRLRSTPGASRASSRSRWRRPAWRRPTSRARSTAARATSAPACSSLSATPIARATRRTPTAAGCSTASSPTKRAARSTTSARTGRSRTSCTSSAC